MSFVQGATRLLPVELLPELRLRQGGEALELWAASGSGALPFWAFAWAGGLGLARYVLDHPELVRGRTVLDFGCGGGVVGIAAARAGARVVEGVDVDPAALEAAALNAADNGVALELRLGDPTAGPPAEAEIVLAGDICYERPMAEEALAWLLACAEAGSRVLIGDPGRSYAPAEAVELARIEVPTRLDLEAGARCTCRILELRPGRS